ncbi:MAG: FAD:protein FMN transferase [Pirellulales bacterium]
MATRWRMRIAGDDADRIAAVADELPAEIDRWERILSRFHPASELRRLNQAPVDRLLRIGGELAAALSLARHATRMTHGFFDPRAMTGMTVGGARPWELDEAERTFVWTTDEARLDLGGFGKGYALDRLGEWLRERGVAAALLDAGGSSLLTWGETPEPAGWPVDLLDPSALRDEDAEQATSSAASPTARLTLRDAALSYSAVRPDDAAAPRRDPTVDPRTGEPVAAGRGCVIVCASAAWAEMLSTACLCMGESAAAKFLDKMSPCASRMWWLETGSGAPRSYVSSKIVED